MERNRRVLEQFALEVLGDEPSQPAVGDQVVASAEESRKAGQRVARKTRSSG